MLLSSDDCDDTDTTLRKEVGRTQCVSCIKAPVCSLTLLPLMASPGKFALMLLMGTWGIFRPLTVSDREFLPLRPKGGMFAESSVRECLCACWSFCTW